MITAGGTCEEIDGVRHIANFSRGGTGAILTNYLRSIGYEVMLLRAKYSIEPNVHGGERIFVTSHDLETMMNEELSHHHYDAVIHLAAISDFLVEEIILDGKKVQSQGGISKKISSGSTFALEMKPNKKLINGIKKQSENPNVRLVGFKLSHNTGDEATRQKIAKIFHYANADYVVHNELTSIVRDQHPARIFSKSGGDPLLTGTKEELARAIHHLLTGG
ncbi:MAG: hypothetical protein KDK72_04080 [Chlamydiia bacterium]|nr:hypothetical protein [Chlamydiia bacterium]